MLGSPEIKFEVLVCSRAGAARQLPSHSEDEVMMRTTVMMTMVVMMIVTMINTSKQSVICRQVQGEKKILCAMPVFPLLLLQH